MKVQANYFITGSITLILLFFINISLGSVHIPLKEIFKILSFQEASNATWEYIIFSYRLPKAVTAIIVGSGLAVSGLLMQTLFRNPLAGPYVLGLSSGASLGVACLLMAGSWFGSIFQTEITSPYSIIVASSLGSFLVLLAVLAMAAKVKNTMAILIIGLMFASFTGAVVSILSFFSSAEKLQQYIFWSFGSLGDLNWEEVSLLSLCWAIGLILALCTLKNLNALLLGESYARSLGTKITQNKFIIILATSLLAGSITAFAGPIAFVGIAVPHLVKVVIKGSNHFILYPASIMAGSTLMLICDTIAQLPGSEYTLPINAITALFGAPIVIWLLTRKKKITL